MASRNFPTSTLRRLLSPDSDLADASTLEEADPVWLAPRCTSTMLAETCWVPRAASMVALSASRLVWPAIWLMSSTTSPIRPAALASSPTWSLVVVARGASVASVQ
jgi:hypothetical protein